jgi:DNA-binding IscR family transcriptional regulator
VGDPHSPKCRLSEGCVTRTVWERISESINTVIDNITLQHMIDEQQPLNKKE